MIATLVYVQVKPEFIQGFIERAKKYNLSEYDHILFSYHGLPERQVDKVYDKGLCADHNCENEITEDNKFCYKATCYATTRLLARMRRSRELGIHAAHGDRDAVLVRTSMGGEQRISTTKYEVSGRGGKGREVITRGHFVSIVLPPATAPEPFEEG